MAVQEQTTTQLNVKAQSAFDSAASGAGATAIEVTGGAGLAMQFAQIQGALFARNRMARKPRQGSKFVTAAYETLLRAQAALDPVFSGTLGGAWVAAQTFTNADWGNITGVGATGVLTFSAGTLVTDGIVAGMVAKFTNLSVAGNNSIYLPILSVTEGTMTVPVNATADQASDSAWSVSICKSLYTPTPYVGTYYTVEEVLADIDVSKRGINQRFNALTIDAAADQEVKCSFGLGGNDMTFPSGGSSPVFTSPTLVTPPPLVLLDGALYVNGTDRIDLTGMQLGLQAPVSGVPMLRTKTSPGVFLGMFNFTGQLTGIVDSTFFSTDAAAWLAESNLSIFAHFAEQGGVSDDFISVYIGNASFGGFSSQASGPGGALPKTLIINAGSDDRGTGYAPSTMVVSQSG